MTREIDKLDNVSYLMLIQDVLTWFNVFSICPACAQERLREGLKAIEQAEAPFTDQLERETTTGRQWGNRTYWLVATPANNRMHFGFRIEPKAEAKPLFPREELRQWYQLAGGDFDAVQPLIVELLAIWIMQLRAHCERDGSLTVPIWPKRD